MRHLAVVLAFLAGFWSVSTQAATFFPIDINFGPQLDESFNSTADGRLTGRIVTDGSTGALSLGNILSWSFTFEVPGFAPFTIDSNGIAGTASVRSLGSALFVDGVNLTLRALIRPDDDLEFRNGDRFFLIAQSQGNANGVFLGLNTPGDSGLFNFVSTVVPQNTVVGSVPVPAALPLALTGLGALGLLGWRRRAARATALHLNCPGAGSTRPCGGWQG